jgi:hypothetical protein
VAAVDPLIWQLPRSRAHEARWPYQVLYGLAVEFDGVHTAYGQLRDLMKQIERDGGLPPEVAPTLARIDAAAVSPHDTSQLIATLREQGLTAAADSLHAAQEHRLEALQVLRDLRQAHRLFGRLLSETTVPRLQASSDAFARTARALAEADAGTIDALPTLGHPTLTPPGLRKADRQRLEEPTRRPRSADGYSL